MSEPDLGADPSKGTPIRDVTAPGRGKSRSWKSSHTKWSRLIHVYTSMISMLIVLFFGLTGITLNHPDWTFGSAPVTTTTTGMLPAEAFTDDRIEFLIVSEHLRSEHGVEGQVSDFGETNTEATIRYKNPGYTADVFFDPATGDYTLTEIEQGWLTVMNELHKGRDGSPMWRWIVDISGALLVVISLTGLYLQFFLRKRRRAALTVAVGSTLLVVLLMWMAVG